MNKKLIAQIVIIIFAFGGSGFVLYNGLFKKKPSTLPNINLALPGGASSNTEITVDKILPYGDSLDFDGVLDKQDFQYGIVTFEELDVKNDVGISEKVLMKPLKEKEEAE